ncbi:AAA-like domain-containing protein [Scytonema sp. NUACC26]|uniref:AAA-like domain-containing protein n=1 Tax=Scytonema sp. NUACC26 TaxID=3140176 RepID=UPI0034DC187E
MNFQEALKIVDAAIYDRESRHLNDVELTIFRGSWEGRTYDEMAEDSQYKANYLKGDVGHKFWNLLSEALGERVSKSHFREVVERSQSRFSYKDNVPIQSENQEASGLNKYVPPSVEPFCQEQILIPGALLRIKASPKMGKTLLMSRLINHATNIGYKAVVLQLREAAQTNNLGSLDKFLQWFCINIAQELGLESPLEDKHWHNQFLDEQSKCTKYFENYLLKKDQLELVLGLDEVERIYESPEVAKDFLSLLRSWHEKAKTSVIWKKLRLILAYTEEYTLLDINRSPFNVGELIELQEFNSDQVKDLADRYGLKWDVNREVKELMEMVGGHPYLVRKAITYVKWQNKNLETLLEMASTEARIYSDLLQEHRWNLKKYPELNRKLQEVVSADSPIKLELDLALKLYELGLVKLQENSVQPRCELYRLYFRSYFKEPLKDAQ